MAVLFADTFFQSVGKLQPKEQARVIAFVNRFQTDPSHPGMSLERLNTKSKDVWSGRITRDLRAILHQDGEDWALLYADHHDPAYRWAERRQVGRHPVTGIIQVVESVEAVPEVRAIVEKVPAEVALFDEHEDPYLLSLGVPDDWLPTLRKIGNDDQLLVAVEKLPSDVAERLLDLAAGELVTPPTPVAPGASPVDHPDTRRRFFVAENSDELLHALEAPMERWVAFLHPSQRKLAEGTFSGPVKVTGSAGTGKTVVAMHRARHLARQGHRVLLTTFVTTLCKNIERSLAVLCSPDELERITVSTVHSEALRVARRSNKAIHPADGNTIRDLLNEHAKREAPQHPVSFVRTEFSAVIQAQGIRTWQEYRKAKRTGRGTPLSTKDRKALWRVFEAVQNHLARRDAYDWAGICRRARELLEADTAHLPYDAVLVDEVQDLTPPALRFLATLCREHPERLMVVGDAGQRIYPGGFALTSLGIPVRGRSHILKINYRTTEQIRRAADRMLGQVTDDLDAGVDQRDGTRSLLTGPHPTMLGFSSQKEEMDAIVKQVGLWLGEGLDPEAIAVFARTKQQLDQLEASLKRAGTPTRRLSDSDTSEAAAVRLGTMHRAKGLEFKAVLVAGCSDGVLPSRGLLKALSDPQDREDAEVRERRLLYVAMTRARDELAVTWSGEPSPFLAPLLASQE